MNDSRYPLISRSGNGGGNRLKRAAMRETSVAILDAAISIVREAGTVEALTMRGLARRVGLTLPLLYRYVADKESLVAMARQRASEPLRQRLQAVLAETPGTGGLVDWVECYLSADSRDPWIHGLLVQGGVTGGGVELRDQASLVALDQVEQRLRAVARRGGLVTGVSPRVGAWLLWAGAHAALVVREVMRRGGEPTEGIAGPAVSASIVRSVVADMPPASNTASQEHILDPVAL